MIVRLLLPLLCASAWLAAPALAQEDTWKAKELAAQGWTVTSPKGWTVEAPDKDDLAEEQVLTFNNGAEPETLDPALMTGVPESTLARAMFEGLTVAHPKTLEPMPAQAEAWAVSADGGTWRFKIRADARWSNGDPVTAEDFRYSWMRVLNPETAAQYAYQLYAVKGAKAYNTKKGKAEDVGLKVIGTHVLEVELVAPTPYFLQLTYFGTLYPVHRKTVETHKDKWTRPEHIVSNGPFVMTAHEPKSKIVYEKNAKYWAADRVHLTQIVVLPIDDSNTAMNKYLNEEIDWARAVPASRIEEAKKNPDYFVQPYLGSYFYSFNVTKKPFDDVRVRKAFWLATNRERITKDVLKAGQIPTTSYCPPGLFGYEAPKGDAFNPLKAKALLKEAGYPDGKGFPEVELLYNTSEDHKLVAEAIVDMWKRTLGVNVKLRNEEWKVYLKSVDGLNYQIARRGWIGDYGDPNTFLDMFVTQGGNNNTGWSREAYDKAIALAAKTSDAKERMKILAGAERLLLKEAPIMPIYHYVNQGFLAPTVGGWHENIRDIHPFQFIYKTE